MTEDREVLRVHGHLAAVDRAGAGDDGVAVGPLGVHAEGVRAVADELVELHEGAVVEQLVDALAGGHLAARVLLLDGGLAARGDGLVVPLLEVGELAGGRVHVRGAGVLVWLVCSHPPHCTGGHGRRRCGPPTEGGASGVR
jgi:hypothetical protein